ncbi:MAG: leucine-rich repeat domain-containing protein, partial [Oscillospiraceae bacterium]|nr:leucine-rich repeat domain-containing protein [Oscillospiraceae bacterium]
MKVKKRLLGLLLAVVMLAGILPVAASAGWHDSTHIAYEVTDGNIYFDKATGTIVDCDESVTTANIPEAIDGTPVTSIGSGAFEDCISLTSVEIPSNVTSIGDGAFHDCVGLTGVTIPNNVTSIGREAFGYCANLTSVTVPNSVTSIGFNPFSYCKNLTGITVDAGGSAYTSENGVLFNKNKTELICVPGGISGAYVIPNSVTRIVGGAFCGCSSLTSVTIPSSVTSIEYSAFERCICLTSVTIPNSVTSIGAGAFGGCSGLTSVEIPSSVTSIEDSVFRNCFSLERLTIPNSVTSIGANAFESCISLTSVEIPSSVTSIKNGAFYKSNSIKDVHYGGTEAQWKAINIGYYNEPLRSATIHYNSGTPTEIGNPFTDVNKGAYYYDAVLWAVNHDPQITTGTSATKFSPNAT